MPSRPLLPSPETTSAGNGIRCWTAAFLSNRRISFCGPVAPSAANQKPPSGRANRPSASTPMGAPFCVTVSSEVINAGFLEVEIVYSLVGE